MITIAMIYKRAGPLPLKATRSSSRAYASADTFLSKSFAFLTLSRFTPSLFIRQASHKAQGAVNGPKNGPGKRLGAKKTGNCYVIPGNIIFRQRGTHWFPGENCAMGRDHTIYATESGWVRYYKDPLRHAKRQYIGIVFERHQMLPVPANQIRRRRLGMLAVPIVSSALHEGLEQVEAARDLVSDADTDGKAGTKGKSKNERREIEGRNLALKDGYMYREANWQIGRAAETAKVRVREYKPGDRWTAWKKATKRKQANAAKSGMGRKKR